MRDFIFIIGTSGVGKTTLAKGLFKHYKGAYTEMSMVPEFGVPENVDEGIFEEKVCWECCVVQLKKFNELGIKNVYHDLLPTDKVSKVEELIASNKSPLIFVGDGINDAPVLMRADVGVSMGGLGSDAALEASDIVIMDDDIFKINTAIKIAKKLLES